MNNIFVCSPHFLPDNPRSFTIFTVSSLNSRLNTRRCIRTSDLVENLNAVSTNPQQLKLSNLIGSRRNSDRGRILREAPLGERGFVMPGSLLFREYSDQDMRMSGSTALHVLIQSLRPARAGAHAGPEA
jgi:hypothetical protein